MNRIPLPANETERLNMIQSMKVLKDKADKELQNIVEFCSDFFEVPIALITVLHADMQEFLAKKGLKDDSTTREAAFCSHAIMQSDVFEVIDAHQDIRFSQNPFVVGDPHIVFYAGKPLLIEQKAIGTLCLLDNKPRKLTEKETALLSVLAAKVEYYLEQKERNIRLLELMDHYHAELLRNQESRDKLMQVLAAISHDAIGPVRSINQLMQFQLESKDALPEELIVEMSQALHSSEDMLREMIDWGKMEYAAATDNNGAFLSEVMKELQDELKMDFIKKGNTLEMQTPSKDVMYSKMKLKFILRNLLHNANKFSNNSTIRLTSRSANDTLEIRIQDEGAGMDAKKLLGLNANSQTDSTLGSIGEKGNGIGLPLSFQFARELKGSLLFESELGKGTVAVIKLPI
ncbi:MAG: GAF domain-containing sensor histidine kinase [Bacteroidetes bacterium]|nr:MAG: GAF domain-containing sensor histidine kinase [Bacteroidota bacterium]